MALATDTNHGPLVNVAMWITLAPTCIAAIVKLYTKWTLLKRFQGDDALMLIALLFAVVQSIATTQQVHFGLGQHQNNVDDESVQRFFLAQYVAQLFYLLTIYTSKTIGLWFFQTMTLDPRRGKLVVRCMLLSIMAWTVVGVFVICFQCRSPQPWLWLDGKCIDQGAFWTVNIVVDTATQLAVGLLPIFLLQGLHASPSTKILAKLAWTPNLLTIPIAIARLSFLRSTPLASDYTWDSFNVALTTALHSILSVMGAAVPFSKQFVDSLVSMPHRIGDETLIQSSQSRGRSKSKSLGSLVSMGKMRPEESNGENTTTVFASDHNSHEMENYDTRDGSQDRMVIYQTRTAVVKSTPL